MKDRVRTACLLLALTLTAGSANGQVTGIPVYNNGVPGGLGIAGDIGFSNDDAGDGTAYAGTLRLGLGLIGVTGTISGFNPDGPAGTDVSVGGTLNYRLLGGPLVPLNVTLQGGIAYAKPDDGILPGQDVKDYRFPVGIGFALVIPNPALAIRPWLAPRLDIHRVSATVGSFTDTNFGLSGGIELNFLNGFGLHAAYDRVFADSGDPGVFGVGAHYGLRIPGL